MATPWRPSCARCSTARCRSPPTCFTKDPPPSWTAPSGGTQRAQYLAAAGYAASVDDIRADARRLGRRRSQRAADHEEAVLWFEHDLFDQLLLIRTLDMLGALRGAARPGRVSLICINAFLGYLTAGAAARAVADARAGHRRAVRDRADASGGRSGSRTRPNCCSARRAPGDRTRLLPAAAVSRRRARAVLRRVPVDDQRAVAHRGLRSARLDVTPALSGAELFRRTQAREARMFLGDTELLSASSRRSARRAGAAGAPLRRRHAGRARSRRRSGSRSPMRAATCSRGEQRRRAAQRHRPVARRRAPRRAATPAWRWDPARKTLVSCR